MLNLRIEKQTQHTEEVQDNIFSVIFPMVRVNSALNIWIDGKKINNSSLEYLEIILLPGKEKAIATLHLIDSEYFVENDFPEDWETKLSQYKYLSQNNIEEGKLIKGGFLFTSKLTNINSTITVINGIPIENTSEITHGFDVDGYYSGLKVQPSKLVIKLKRNEPLSVEVSYCPEEFYLNINAVVDK